MPLDPDPDLGLELDSPPPACSSFPRSLLPDRPRGTRGRMRTAPEGSVETVYGSGADLADDFSERIVTPAIRMAIEANTAMST